MIRWVQSITGKGKKYKVAPLGEGLITWIVVGDNGFNEYLAKSQFKVCGPPEEGEQ